MKDLIFLAATVLLFWLAAAYARRCDPDLRGRPMNLEDALGLLVSLGLLIYLMRAMLRAEKAD